jgi:hypothetical protein
MLVRLIYASRAARALDLEEQLAILKQARAHNPRHGITGVLCHADGLFIQVIEGGRGAVNRLYNRIATDTRHTGVELLGYADIGERRFGSWAMGQVNLASINPALLLKYAETSRLDPYALSGQACMALFDELLATAAIICPN